MAVPSLFVFISIAPKPAACTLRVEVAMGGKHITGFFLALRRSPLHDRTPL